MSYTKGPWEIISKGATIYQIGPIYAEEYAGESWLEVCRADANLIAAAPNLLECLEMIVAEADSYTARTGKPVYNWLDDSRAAIAKARGENQK